VLNVWTQWCWITRTVQFAGMMVTFLSPLEPQISAMYCVALHKIDPSHMVCVRLFVALCQHYSTPSWPLPFRSDKISRKGEFFDRFSIVVFVRKPDECSKLASLRASPHDLCHDCYSSVGSRLVLACDTLQHSTEHCIKL